MSINCSAVSTLSGEIHATIITAQHAAIAASDAAAAAADHVMTMVIVVMAIRQLLRRSIDINTVDASGDIGRIIRLITE